MFDSPFDVEPNKRYNLRATGNGLWKNGDQLSNQEKLALDGGLKWTHSALPVDLGTKFWGLSQPVFWMIFWMF